MNPRGIEVYTARAFVRHKVAYDGGTPRAVRTCMKRAILIVLLVAHVGLSLLAAQQNIYQRPTIANAIIAGSKNLFDGTYVTNGTSGICGEIPKMSSLTGEDTFVIEFTGNAPSNTASVLSLAFGSKELVRGVTKSPLFRLMVSVRTRNGGEPPAYVLNTDARQAGNSGVATLTYKGNTATLQVSGTNDMNQTITLIVSCG
jgi:hypothetical protein